MSPIYVDYDPAKRIKAAELVTHPRFRLVCHGYSTRDLGRNVLEAGKISPGVTS